MSEKTPISKEVVRTALETVRQSLQSAQTQARLALVALHAARPYLKSLDPAMMQMVTFDADIEQRLNAVDTALGQLDSMLDEEDIEAMKVTLRAAASPHPLPLSGPPAGTLLN